LIKYTFKILLSSRQREAIQDLAPMLWHSFGSIAALLQEVISVYPAINPPTLTVLFLKLQHPYEQYQHSIKIINLKGTSIESSLQ
jgi:hypothetical protein